MPLSAAVVCCLLRMKFLQLTTSRGCWHTFASPRKNVYHLRCLLQWWGIVLGTALWCDPGCVCCPWWPLTSRTVWHWHTLVCVLCTVASPLVWALYLEHLQMFHGGATCPHLDHFALEMGEWSFFRVGDGKIHLNSFGEANTPQQNVWFFKDCCTHKFPGCAHTHNI